MVGGIPNTTQMVRVHVNRDCKLTRMREVRATMAVVRLVSIDSRAIRNIACTSVSNIGRLEV